MQLLNPIAWLKAGAVSLDISTLRRADKRPVGGVQVEAMIEGALETSQHSAMSDDQGRVRIEFPLPPLGKGDLALVIHAKTGYSERRNSLHHAIPRDVPIGGPGNVTIKSEWRAHAKFRRG